MNNYLLQAGGGLTDNAMTAIRELVLPVIQKASDWGIKVALGLITLQIIYQLIIKFIRDL